MNVLVLGGTGAMGRPLCDILVDAGHCVCCVSRSSPREVNGKINYLQGDAHDGEFISRLCRTEWDAIVDFMVYNTAEFIDISKIYLASTKQYVFISSARVYAESPDNIPITEDSPRLLDCCKDEEYLKTDEYALAKARQEDILKNSGYNNWTIIRPSITYNTHRLQLGGFEKEEWLYRALKGRKIVFSHDIIDKVTTLTCGDDVAKGIFSIIGQEKALGESFHITENKFYTWREILDIYLSTIEELTGLRPKVVMTNESVIINFRKYQMIYCKLYNRQFDCSKINQFVDTNKFITAKDGLKECLIDFLKDPKFSNINWKLEAINDKTCKQLAHYNEFKSYRKMTKYLLERYSDSIIVSLLKRLKNVLR